MNPPIPHRAECLSCKYPLRELTEPRCPECGKTFDPGEPNTYGPRIGWLDWRSWAQPPPLWQIGFIIFVALFVLDEASRQVAPSGWVFCVCPLLLLMLAVDYGVRLYASTMVRKHPPVREHLRSTRRQWRWAVLPIAALIAVLAESSPWLLGLRFRLSLPSFQQTVTGLQNATKTNYGSQFIGLYYVNRIDRDGSSFAFITGNSWVDPVGFTYHPAPSNTSGPYHLRLTPNWSADEY